MQLQLQITLLAGCAPQPPFQPCMVQWSEHWQVASIIITGAAGEWSIHRHLEHDEMMEEMSWEALEQQATGKGFIDQQV
jgi:hypothetical protein